MCYDGNILLIALEAGCDGSRSMGALFYHLLVVFILFHCKCRSHAYKNVYGVCYRRPR